MIEDAIYEHLKNNVPLVAGRVFANVLHQSTVKPALVYTVISEKYESSLGGECKKPVMDWQIHIYGEKYRDNKLVKNEVKDALDALTYVKNFHAQDGFDEESELFVQVINFTTKD